MINTISYLLNISDSLSIVFAGILLVIVTVILRNLSGVEVNKDEEINKLK